ncbi:MAG: GntR family transcriptional regulator [Candidatus Firestonebacteria bacterium]
MNIIQKESPIYITTQLKENLQKRILANEFSVDTKLPSERELAQEYNISRISVRSAIKELENEDFLYKVRSKGTFVKNRQDFKIVSKKSISLLVSPPLRMSFFSTIISGIEEAASKNDYDLFLRCTNEDTFLEKKYILELNESKNSGLIIISGANSFRNAEFFKNLAQKNPMVVIDMFLGEIPADYVFSDDEKGTYDAIMHLIELGHTRILHLAGPKKNSTASLRIQGYKKTLQEKNIAIDTDLIRETDWSLESGYYETKKFFTNNKKRATAIFACSDEVAIGAYKAVKELGLKIPEDISLVGYANLDVGRLWEVPLTTVDQSPEKMGREAFNLLSERIERKRSFFEVKKIPVPTNLIIRESCGIKLKGG